MRQYSSDKVDIAWLGLDFGEGLATGTFITEARTSPTFTQKMQARGQAVRVFNTDKSGTVTNTVDQESALHQQLLALAEEDRDPEKRNIVGVMVIREVGISVMRYSNAYIMTEPDETRGTESASFGWVFAFEAKTSENIPEPANLVGN